MTIILFVSFFFNDTATTEIYTLSLHDALPIYTDSRWYVLRTRSPRRTAPAAKLEGRPYGRIRKQEEVRIAAHLFAAETKRAVTNRDSTAPDSPTAPCRPSSRVRSWCRARTTTTVSAVAAACPP